MKKFFVVVGLLLAAFTGLAQLASKSKFSDPGKTVFGIKAGYNVAWITGTKGDFKPESKTGFMAGAFLTRGRKTGFGYRTELIFSRQGFSYNDEGKKEAVTQDYIYLPQLTTFTIGKFMQLQAGGQIGYLLNAKRSGETGSGVKKIVEYYNRIDYGFAGGVEIYPFKGLLAGARYNVSLGNIYKKVGTGTPSPLPMDPAELKGKNSVIQIFAGYRF